MLIFTATVEMCKETIVASDGILHWGKLRICFDDCNPETTLAVETKDISEGIEEGFV
jgi:hypothetical protein